MQKTKEKIEFGDFQTPLELTCLSIDQIENVRIFDRIIEPTCGEGNFLLSLLDIGVPASHLEGWEINPNYVEKANNKILIKTGRHSNVVKEKDFFSFDVQNFNCFEKNILFIGNPPWVTNSELGRLLSNNLPNKLNIKGLSGLEAMTGKSNFDISEWILIQLIKLISGTLSSVAFLVKTSVARKVFEYSCENNLYVGEFKMKKINAKKYFNANVDACLFLASGLPNKNKPSKTLEIYSAITETRPKKVIGFINGKLISNIFTYDKLKSIDIGSEFKWRSGIKHDASKIMEFSLSKGVLMNGHKEKISFPMHYLYPMYKSSELSKEETLEPCKFMLVTQTKVGDSTEEIKNISPKTWEYLINNSQKLDSRKSSIYKNAPRFAIFGVGEYTFKPYKIAISGLYKSIKFKRINPFDKKPVVLDDTCYMLGFDHSAEADLIFNILTSAVCQEFIRSIIFLDNKRPITAALLNRISMREVSKKIGLLKKFDELFPNISGK